MAQDVVIRWEVVLSTALAFWGCTGQISGREGDLAGRLDAATAGRPTRDTAGSVPGDQGAIGWGGDAGGGIPNDKHVFGGRFPLTAKFRQGPTLEKSSYEDWLTFQPGVGGHRPDLITYPLAYHPQTNVGFADRFARENPKTLMLATWRAASGTPAGVVKQQGDRLEESKIGFPGHWVLYPGTTLAASLPAASTTLKVSESGKLKPGPALLVETSGAKKLWDRFEYVRITKINGSSVTVTRAFNGSPPARSFPAESTYVAPIASDSRTRQQGTNWTFNITASCPRDGKGQTAADILLQEMARPLASGALRHFGGLDLASGPFNTSGPQGADYDCDGTADAQGSAKYRQGVYEFLDRARNIMGSGRVVIMRFDDLLLLDHVNGANQEGLGGPRDPWKDGTKTVNEALAWRRLSKKLPSVHLAFVQYMSPQEEKLKVQLHRLLYGYSACLGMAAALPDGYDEDPVAALALVELFKGTENEPRWLGKATGPVQRIAASSPNLLGGTGSSDWNAMLKNLEVGRGSAAVVGNELVLTPDSASSSRMQLTLRFAVQQGSDFTVLMEAKSEGQQASRQILEPLVSIGTTTKALRASLSNRDFVPVGFYAREAESSGIAELTLRFEGDGAVRIRALGAHAAPDALACSFEHGVVLVNPSLGDLHVDLTKLFPGRSGYRRLETPQPTGAIPAAYQQQLAQTKALNSGGDVGDPGSVLVPSRNALFLISH